LSYLLAARHVIETGRRDERLSDVAVPALYLQRHALEVELKSWIEACDEIEHDRAWLKLLQVNRRARRPLLVGAKALHHYHLDLWASLRTKVHALGFGRLPGIVRRVCDRVAKLEARAPERFRYRKVQFGKSRLRVKGAKSPPYREAFPKPLRLPVVELQNELEEVFSTVFHFEIVDSGDGKTLATRLGYECYALSQTIGENYLWK
jgi:hypothetical protein